MSVEAGLVDLRVGRSALDRWFYVGMAGMVVAIAVAGFAPRSLQIISGELRNPPMVVHVHAVLMGAWLLLFLAQTTLVARGSSVQHRRLGVAALVVAPLMWFTMIATAVTWHGFMSSLDASLAAFATNMLLSLLRSILLFPAFFVIALAARKHAPETHKRMMLLATVLLMSGGLDRMDWLPGQMLPFSYDGTHAYQLLLLLPALVYDIVRLGRPHGAYLLGLGLLVPWMIATHFLWGSPWWLGIGPKLVGAD